jgi:hypothetical protein
VRQTGAQRSTHLIPLKGTEPQGGVFGLLVRAYLIRVRARTARTDDNLCCLGSYMRTRICVFATTGLTGRRGAVLHAVEPSGGRLRHPASVGGRSQVRPLRGADGLRRSSGAFRRPEPRGFGRAGDGCGLMGLRRRAERNLFWSTRRRPKTRSSDGGFGRGRGLRTAASKDASAERSVSWSDRSMRDFAACSRVG